MRFNVFYVAFVVQSFEVLCASWDLGTQAEANDEQSWRKGYIQMDYRVRRNVDYNSRPQEML